MRILCVLWLAFLGTIGLAQEQRVASSERVISDLGSAIEVTPCDLVKDPPRYNQKLVRVRGQINLDSEEFSLVTSSDCAPTSVWLAFGGDVETPITYCCGPHKRSKGEVLTVQGKKIPLQKDEQFRLLWRFMTAKTIATPSKGRCDGCYVNDVSATITGVYFAGEKQVRNDGKTFYTGYGHMGMSTLLAIEQIAQVRAVKKQPGLVSGRDTPTATKRESQIQAK